MKTDDLTVKVDAFSKAIKTYQTHWFYRHCGEVVSSFIVLLQIITLIKLYQTYDHTNLFILIFIFIIAYSITDFVNGFVHMMMDNNTHYTSLVGPFIAAFHLHHATPKYTKRHPVKVYFDESGSKFWLLVYLLLLVLAQHTWSLNYRIDFGLVCVGILSSVAELSHYWCHNATKKNKIIKYLQAHHILLSNKYHAIHHTADNIQYCFLNGMADPLINRIARHWYKGYKQHADQHVAAYEATTTLWKKH